MTDFRLVDQETYYRHRLEEGEACPLCKHATGIGWGFIEYCPRCGWNTVTGVASEATADLLSRPFVPSAGRETASPKP